MMTTSLSHKSAYFWAVLLLGLYFFSQRCDARAVNVSNTWTMPQEGLNVFYRFFRDRISWFEADAVCQFHHANLVTVDNSFQFDATRDLLRELDVNDIVWIGLMRPQNAERFMWSNSRPLVADTGYWAESLPLMDAPLCAVIDPIRDYRWHALRCGGPETASFLCEMPVPSWADACILRDMPNLTMQYMADTASIELIRNCEEEGLIKQSCKSKHDREHVIRELICPRERLEAQRINDITNSHFKSLQIINSIRTDNNENNDIELLPLGQSYESNRDFGEEVQTEKNTVQRLIEQFNVDELMQADEPSTINNGFIIPGEIPKPVKKSAKKVVTNGESDYLTKKEKSQKYAGHEQQQKQKKQQMLALEDMMMGDQPPQQGEPEVPDSHSIDDDVSNEIMEPLPHKKKILPQDLRTMATITEKPIADVVQPEKEETTLAEESTSSQSPATTTTTTTTTITTTTAQTSNPSTHTTNGDVVSSLPSASMSTLVTDIEDNGSSIPTFSDQTTISPHPGVSPSATIGHPMHPQQPRSNVITEETQHPHVKESADNSHFIPPMLLVKSHYVPPTKHGEHHQPHDDSETEHKEHAPHLDTIDAATTTITDAIEIINHEHATDGTPVDSTNAAAATTQHSSVATTAGTEAHAKIIEEPLMNLNREAVEKKSANNTTANEGKLLNTEASNIASTATTTTTTTMASTSTMQPIEIITEPKDITATLQPITANANTEAEAEAGKAPADDATTPKTVNNIATTAEQATDIAAVTSSPTSTPITTAQTEIQKAPAATSAGIADKQETSPPVTTTTTTAKTTMASTTAATTTTTITTTTTAAATTTTASTTMAPEAAAAAAATSTPSSPITTTAPVTTTVTTAAAPIMTTTTTTDAPLTSTHNFLKEDTDTPFKPNRRRSLTKPETVSYFKKILG